MNTNIEAGRQIVKKYAGWAAGAGLIPVPLVDVAGVTAVQIVMIREIADLYKIPHQDDRIKTIILSLVGGIGSYGIAASGLGSLVKAVPFIGTALGMALMPATAIASSIALGEVFILHFESGGTLLDFDTDKMAAKFRAAAEQAKAGKEPAVAAPDAGAGETATAPGV